MSWESKRYKSKLCKATVIFKGSNKNNERALKEYSLLWVFLALLPVKILYEITFHPQSPNLYEGYVFTGVCLSTGGCLPLVPGCLPRGGVCHTLQSDNPWSDTLWSDTPQSDTPWADTSQCMLGYTSPAQCMLGYGLVYEIFTKFCMTFVSTLNHHFLAEQDNSWKCHEIE